MAIKGASEKTDDRREIFSSPKKVDVGRQQKPAKHGLQTFIVGTTRAKDLILDTRVKLKGSGPGAMHWYRSVRPDYWDQLVSEVKAPSKLNRNRKVWKKKAGVRNEALDCEVYALHAARACKTNLMHEAHWNALERNLRQRTLLSIELPATLQPSQPDDDETPPLPQEEKDDDTMMTASNTEPTPAVQTTAPLAKFAKPAKKRTPAARGGYSIGQW